MAADSHRGDRVVLRGFTLLEAMVTITIIAVVAVTAAPLFSDEHRVRLMAASALIASDIEAAQVMTMSFPDQAVVVRFDPDQSRYWLAYSWDTETPIMRPDSGEYYDVVLGQGRAASALNVAFTLDQLSANMLEFNAQGGLVDFTARPSIQLGSGEGAVTLMIAPSTGTITEVQGPIK
jgi:prepilin-type N-terminal cleavage/methylation domain-containing protein